MVRRNDTRTLHAPEQAPPEPRRRLRPQGRGAVRMSGQGAPPGTRPPRPGLAPPGPGFVYPTTAPTGLEPTPLREGSPAPGSQPVQPPTRQRATCPPKPRLTGSRRRPDRRYCWRLPRAAGRPDMFGFRVIRQYEQGIVFRWGRGRVEVERGHGKRTMKRPKSTTRPDSVSVRGEIPGKQRLISFPLQFEPLTDKKATSYGRLFVVNASLWPVIVPVPLARVGPPRLRPAPWRSPDIGPVLVDELVLMTFGVGPQRKSPDVITSKVQLTQAGQPQRMSSVYSHRPPL